MDALDLFSMRETFNRQNIMLCFNGPITHTLIEEIGHALRNYLQVDNAHPSSAIDVFAVYIEMTQNIRHYALNKGWLGHDSAMTMVIARKASEPLIGSLRQLADGRAFISLRAVI